MRTIVQDGAPVLRDIAEEVPEDVFGTPEFERLLADMAEALDKEPEGVALAAPQVGVGYRLFIVRQDRVSEPSIREESGEQSVAKAQVDVYINPEIVKTSRKRTRAEEGCLSVRGVYGSTMPHERVTLRARRPDGISFERGAGGLLAQIFEHEINHLNGILFIDHATGMIELRPKIEHE